jgi:hypothetical protein
VHGVEYHVGGRPFDGTSFALRAGGNRMQQAAQAWGQ